MGYPPGHRRLFPLDLAENAVTTNYLLMEDDATVTLLTQCNTCGYLFRDIDKHVRESVTVRGTAICPVCDLPIIEHDDQERKRCHDACSGYIR